MLTNDAVGFWVSISWINLALVIKVNSGLQALILISKVNLDAVGFIVSISWINLGYQN